MATGLTIRGAFAWTVAAALAPLAAATTTHPGAPVVDAGAAADVRPAIAAHLLAGEDRAALKVVEKLLATDRAAAADGFDYTRAHLLDRLGQPGEAAAAFAMAFARGPAELRPFARFRMALSQERLGHPEVAAGLVATLLSEEGPPSLLPRAVRLLTSTIQAGGDCRVLAGLAPQRLSPAQRREIALAQVACSERAGEDMVARQGYLSLIRASNEDEVARIAAERLAALGGSSSDDDVDRFLGLAFHQHREFDRATAHLEAALRGSDGRDVFEIRYALLRSHFWQNLLRAAALGFDGLAEHSRDASDQALALFQAGRSHELLGDDAAASAAFRRAYLAEPRGENASPALLSALRVDWRRGLADEATALLELLATQSAWRSAQERGALHLASSVIAGNRDATGRHLAQASPWLDRALKAGAPIDEVQYWRGRLAEVRSQPAAALTAYGAVLRAAPFGPFATASRARLGTPQLAAADRLETQLAAERRTLRRVLASDPRSAPFVAASAAPVAAWPLWRSPLRTPEERLLGLGGWSEAGGAVGRHFPSQDPALVLAAAALLTQGGEARRALASVETLAERIPARVPPDLVSVELRRALYPHPYRALVEREARRRRVDPHLVVAILREESRFDPRALSGASARGLAQFVLPTARELAPRAGFPSLRPADLERPEVSIALAALYLSELGTRHDLEPQVVAAYNAGERQAQLWRRDCAAADPAEYISKISFKDTKLYVARVLTSRAQYADLYR